MAERRNRTAKSGKTTDKVGVDLAGLPPWYLATYSHPTSDRGVCSHLYIYGNTAQFGPDVTVSVKYNPCSDNTEDGIVLNVEHHAY